MKRMVKISTLACVALASVSAFAAPGAEATASASYELDLSVGFLSDPARVSYSFGNGTSGSGFAYSGLGYGEYDYSTSFPTVSDPTLGTLQGDSAAGANPTGSYYSLSELNEYTLTFTNNSSRQRAVAFEADFTDSLSAGILNPATDFAGADSGYSIYDSYGNQVLTEYDQVISPGGTVTGGNSYTDGFGFFIGAGQTETFTVYVGGEALAQSTAATPEPMSLGALGIGVVALLRRRKKA